MTLTPAQHAALTGIAGRHGMRLLVNRGQLGIGPSGQAAFAVVYTAGAKRPWLLRSEGDRPIKDEMKAVLS